MAISLSELKLWGSATMALDDSTTAVGGAIDKTKKVVFTDVSGSVQGVSDNNGDTTQTVTVYYRDSAGNIQNETKTLTGQTPVGFTLSAERGLRALKSGTTTGNVAVEQATAERTGTAQAGAAATITLDSGASAVDQYYRGMIIRLTGGTGQYQIRECIDYNGTTKVATVNAAWTTNPDATSDFRVSKGFFFDRSPSEVLDVRRPFYNAGANAPGGATKKYYEKVFFENTNASLDLTSGQVIEDSDPTGVIAFAVEASLGGTTTNGAGNNRQVAPSGLSFDSTAKAVANSGSLTHSTTQAVWLELTLTGGAAAIKSTYTTKLQGNTI